MRPEQPTHNPFFNRFHDPVHRRQDDMPSYAPANESNPTPENSRDIFGELFGLVLLAISFVLLLRAF
jgi:hypothetical protein